MIRSAAMLFQEQGVERTSFTDVLAHSGAPRGSIYHHFPGGKAQLAEEATRYAGDFMAAGLTAALSEDDPPDAIGRFTDYWLELLRESKFAAGCPIVAATLDGDRSPGLLEAAGTAFGQWEEVLTKAIQRRGIKPARARSIATLAIAATEGAIVLARAQRSTKPLERVAGELRQIVANVMSESGAPSGRS
jgi:AcrR family transcriptional regulator